MLLTKEEKKKEIENTLNEINQITDFDPNEDVFSKFRQIKILIWNLSEIGIN